MNLTIGFLTARIEPRIEYFFDSLALQIKSENDRLFHDREFPKEHFPEKPSIAIEIIVVDYFKADPKRVGSIASKFSKAFVAWSDVVLNHVECKPTIWQGKFQLPKGGPWWAKSAYHNTAICLCKTPWIAFVDDRCVLSPQWLECVFQAMRENYAVCGRYEKRANMKVENGVIVDEGELLGMDQRQEFDGPVNHRDWYGGSCALPLEWCLRVNGFPEIADGLGMEDCLFGETLLNNGFPIKYDARMKIIEDRTEGQIEGALKRADKNPHLGQQAKSWTLLRMIRGKLQSQNEFDIRIMRERVLNGGEYGGPYASHFDYYDGQPISEME